jgi:hypothetical protein
MSVMSLIADFQGKRLFRLIAALLLIGSALLQTSAPASTFKSSPAQFWGHAYASKSNLSHSQSPRITPELDEETKSTWIVSFSGIPEVAQPAVRLAIDIWSRNFKSKVPIKIDVEWGKVEDRNILASARPGSYFNGFKGAPDNNLWYPSALANALAGKDLDPKRSEILLKVNESVLWSFETDGSPGNQEYDLVSVVLHEIAHGLGFLSNAQYESFFSTGYIFQPTPFDAYVQLPDGRTFADFCSRSTDLGKAMQGPLFWSGLKAIESNGGAKPKLHTATGYLDGTSITHLDEASFAESSKDALMTPLIGPGETFRSPGPLAIAMIDDMLSKPALGVASSLPSPPINLRAHVGDSYALLTFDSQNCSRIDKVHSYEVTVNPDGTKKSFKSSPIRVGPLVNGKKYRFTIVALNNRGSSLPVQSNLVIPQNTIAPLLLDKFSQVTQLATTNYKGLPRIVYGDELSRTLKIATRQSNGWRISTVRRGVQVGSISICKSGLRDREVIHIFYSELQSKDIMHSFSSGETWKHETIDGDGKLIQNSKLFPREKTSSDVSVSNACAVTNSAIQVFYRDDTEGILLGAVKTSNAWIYEVVDGDSLKNDRTTGDVAFSLKATSDNDNVYVLYDSVLSINSTGQPTQGEIRLATRRSAFPEDWKYKTLDGPEQGKAIAGFNTAMLNVQGRIISAWFSSGEKSFPKASKIVVFEIHGADAGKSIQSGNFGYPTGPLTLDEDTMVFGCLSRICHSEYKNSKTKLISGREGFGASAGFLYVSGQKFLAATLKKKLVLLPTSN